MSTTEQPGKGRTKTRQVTAELLRNQRRRASRSRVSGRMAPTAMDELPGSTAAHRPGLAPRWLAGGLGLLAVVVALAMVAGRSNEPSVPAGLEPVALVSLVHGPATVSTPGDGTSHPLEVGMSLDPGDVIVTSTSADGQVGQVALELDQGSSLRIDRDSQVQLMPSSPSSLYLERGAVYLDVAESDSAMEVRTLFGVVRDIGTQFEVRILDGESSSLRVRVREGAVELERPDGIRHRADAGEELISKADGTLERHGVASYGPQWEWVLATAAVPDLEGLPREVFCQWYARQGGWQLVYADPDVEEAAKALMRDNGDDLTAHEAASLVFQGTGLGLRVVEGELRLEALD